MRLSFLGLGLSLLLVGCSFDGTPLHLQEAEEFTRRGEYKEAIGAYHAHIHERLEEPNRPEWENPYFYLLIIGDISLLQGDSASALAAYELAESKGIEKGLISDRFRYVASWLEQREDLEGAVNLLLKYRDRDPLLFDSMLDRLSKEIVAREETARLAQGTPTPTP